MKLFKFCFADALKVLIFFTPTAIPEKCRFPITPLTMLTKVCKYQGLPRFVIAVFTAYDISTHWYITAKDEDGS